MKMEVKSMEENLNMYTEGEIVTMYRQAKDKDKEIDALTHLTLKDEQEIVEILRRNGQKVDGRKHRQKKEAKAKPEPKPQPDPTATVANVAKAYDWITVDGQMLKYLRHLAGQLPEAASDIEEADIKLHIADVMLFLLKEDC